MGALTRSSMVVGAIVAGSLLGGCWWPNPEPQPEPIGIIVSPNPVSWSIESGGGIGTKPVTISTDVAASGFDLSISGTGFTIQSTSCPTSGGTLPADTSCTATLGFASVPEGTQTGQFNVIADDPDGDDISVSVSLSGVASF